ncbi:hypothetical protein A6V27_00020 [Hafnia alvei]|uniref:hypothetical protein n=1 Tax=Hafnia alvei TaxID=569 RepID=UPI0007BCDCAC|nr:hypothetical protein [Hafnia alvei]ANC38877.1 hypothetical protein A6V27_00020 [Hafnia alvei]
MPRHLDRIEMIFNSVIEHQSNGRRIVKIKSILNAARNLDYEDVSPAIVNGYIRQYKLGWAIFEEDKNGLHTYHQFNRTAW